MMFDFGITGVCRMRGGYYIVYMRDDGEPLRSVWFVEGLPPWYLGMNRIGKTRFQCPEAFPIEDDE